MAQQPQDPDQTKKKKPGGASVLVWILLILSFVGLGGWGVTSFGGGVTSIGSVGDKTITTSDYARAVQQEISAFSSQIGQPISFSQAQAIGLDQRALESLVARRSLDAEAERIGLSVGDATVAAAIMAMPAFHGVSGSFDRESYRFTLERNDLSENDFETGIREDEARTLLQGAVLGGFVAPDAVTETFVAHVGERRGFSTLVLSELDLPAPVALPTDAELAEFHAANIDRFTRPEAKRITYVALLPEDLAPEMTVDEAALKAMYQERIAEFVMPERRLVEELIYPSPEAAQAARDRLDAGTTFEALVAERNLTLDQIDLGDVSREELGAAADAVFALTEPGVVGPVETDLGPALMRMNGILAAEETSFEDARETLSAELRTDAARRAIGDRVEAIDDLLAGGITLEDLAREQKMLIGTVDFAEGLDTDDRLAGYPDFRTAAAALTDGDFPEAILLDDGGLVALRFDETVPPSPIPLEEVREQALEDWMAEALAKALSDRAAQIQAEVAAGARLETFGILDVTTEIAREGMVEGMPASVVPGVFEMTEGEVRLFTGDGFTGLVRPDRILPVDPESPEAVALREAIGAQVQQALAQDAFALFVKALQAEMGLSLDQAAISAVQTQLN